MKQSHFTKPKLCKAKGGWYVYFRYNSKKKCYKSGLNYIKNLREREKHANALVRVLHDKLSKGWNPFDPNSIQKNDMKFIQAIDFSLMHKKKRVAKKTYLDYRNSMNYFKKAIKDLRIDYLSIEEVKRSHVRSLLEHLRQEKNWSNMSYNKNLAYLSAILTELLDWDLIEYNPAHKIKYLPTQESSANRTATNEEHLVIKKHLEAHHAEFYNFIRTLYHTGIRPKEILSIKLNMIDLDNNEILLPPEITKSRIKKRNVAINSYLKNMLTEMDLDIYPQDFYLFGSYRVSGAGNRGKFIDFIPAPTKLKRDTATKRWKRIVKDHLKINVNMYSYKHKGGDDKLIAGVDIDSIRNQYGHQNRKMTEHYVKQIKGVYKDDIINNSPDF